MGWRRLCRSIRGIIFTQSGLRCPAFAARDVARLQKADRCPCSASLHLPQAALRLRSHLPTAVTPRLHRRPLTGALNQKLLLLGKGEAKSSEPPYGGGPAGPGEPLKGWRVGLDHNRLPEAKNKPPACGGRFGGRLCGREGGSTIFVARLYETAAGSEGKCHGKRISAKQSRLCLAGFAWDYASGLASAAGAADLAAAGAAGAAGFAATGLAAGRGAGLGSGVVRV